MFRYIGSQIWMDDVHVLLAQVVHVIQALVRVGLGECLSLIVVEEFGVQLTTLLRLLGRPQLQNVDLLRIT